jgi:hypothetical protein
VGARQQRFRFLLGKRRPAAIDTSRTNHASRKASALHKGTHSASKRKTFPVSQPEIDWNSSLRRGRAANRGVGKITLHEYFTAFLRNLYEFWDGMGWNRLERRL